MMAIKSRNTGDKMKIEVNNAVKLLWDLDLPNKALVSITIHESFSDLLEELGEPEAREDVDAVLKDMRKRSRNQFNFDQIHRS
jgi:hypothetical protein